MDCSLSLLLVREYIMLLPWNCPKPVRATWLHFYNTFCIPQAGTAIIISCTIVQIYVKVLPGCMFISLVAIKADQIVLPENWLLVGKMTTWSICRDSTIRQNHCLSFIDHSYHINSCLLLTAVRVILVCGPVRHSILIRWPSSHRI